MSRKENLILFLKNNESGKSDKRNKGSFSDVISASAQVATLLVIVFGYFYTVKPVFQHQLLAEKNAQVELDKVRLEEELARIEEDLVDRRLELDEIVLRNEGLEENIASYENEINNLLDIRGELEEEAREAYLGLQEERGKSDALLKEIEISERRESEAAERVVAIQEQVKTELDALENARWELILTDMQQLGRVDFIGSSWFFGNDSELTITEYLNSASESWPNMYLAVLSAIDRFEEINTSENKYPPDYLEELRDLVTANVDMLRCERPDFNKIESDYYMALEDSENQALAEVNERMDSIRNEYAEDGKVAVFSDDYMDRNYRIALIVQQNRLEADFKIMVSDMRIECFRKVYEFYGKVADIKGLDMDI